MNTFDNCGKTQGVGCDVSACRYHGEGNCCCAGNIHVENRNATEKSETFCATFAAKAE